MKKATDSPSCFLRPRVDIAKYRPCSEDRIIVKRLPWPDEERGIIVPDIAKKDSGPQLGEVIAIGSGATYDQDRNTGKIRHYKDGKRAAYEVKVGDRVLYHRSPVNEYEENWETFTFLYEAQSILGVFDPDIQY